MRSETYNEIKQHMQYDNKMATEELETFIECLPPSLKVSVAITMYKETFEKHDFFIGLRNTKLLTFIAQKLRP